MKHSDSLWIVPQPVNQAGPPPPATGTEPKTVPERPADGDKVSR